MVSIMPLRPTSVIGFRVLEVSLMILSMEMKPQKPCEGTDDASMEEGETETLQILSL